MINVPVKDNINSILLSYIIKARSLPEAVSTVVLGILLHFKCHRQEDALLEKHVEQLV